MGRRGRGRKPRASRRGRPEDAARAVRQRMGEGEDLVRFMMRIVEGNPVRSAGRWKSPTLREVMAAARWLFDRGWGTPVSMVELEHWLARGGSGEGLEGPGRRGRGIS